MMQLRRASRLLKIATVLVLIATAATPALAAPSNDTKRNATVITDLPFSTSQSVDGARAEGKQPSCQGNSQTVWFKYTAPTNETLQLDANTFGSNYDTVLAVLDGNREIACDDDTSGVASQVIFEASAGHTYYFSVGVCCSRKSVETGTQLHFSVTSI
jgi:hypothetical protein